MIEKIDVCCCVKKWGCFCVFNGLNSQFFVGQPHIDFPIVVSWPSCEFLADTFASFQLILWGNSSVYTYGAIF